MIALNNSEGVLRGGGKKDTYGVMNRRGWEEKEIQSDGEVKEN